VRLMFACVSCAELVHRCSKLGKVVDIEVAQYRGNSPSQLVSFLRQRSVYGA
jgi:heterodisulfide reductase subunit C